MIVSGWGGVTLFYRRALNDSPAYRQNHEEVNEALAEGIAIAPDLDPRELVSRTWLTLRWYVEQLIRQFLRGDAEGPITNRRAETNYADDLLGAITPDLSGGGPAVQSTRSP